MHTIRQQVLYLFFAFGFLSITFGQNKVQINLISDYQKLIPGSEINIGINFKIQDEWHIYWLNPGDSGLKPKLKWSLPEGFSVSEIDWPEPITIQIGDLVTFGYEEEVTLLIRLKLPESLDENQIYQISVDADWLVCKIECIPEKGTATLNLANQNDPISAESASVKIADSKFQLPITDYLMAAFAIKTDSSAILFWKSDNRNIRNLRFLPYDEGAYSYLAEQKLLNDGNTYSLEIPFADLIVEDPDSLKGILINSSGWRGEGSETSVEVKVPFSSTEDLQSSDISIPLAILFSFIGGLILNLMPCVLPVLSLKVLSLSNQSEVSNKKFKIHGLLYTFGVLLAFWALIAVLVFLKSSGEQIGWGFQLQSPQFVAILIFILFVFSLNLFGVFELGGFFAKAGSNIKETTGFGGSITSGIAATLLSTPCTAPFMGVAIGFAVTQSAPILFLVFTSLGLGLAFPYLLLSFVPKAKKYIPKPGNWMTTFKQIMGFLLLATVIWLFWVISFLIDNNSLSLLLMVALTVSFIFWVYGKWYFTTSSKVGSLVLKILPVAAAVFVVVFSVNLENSYAAESSAKDEVWLNFSPDLISELEKSNQSYFIDFTAAWCLTCQVNKKVALSSNEILNLFDEKDVTLIRADWTQRNADITKELQKYNRNSVPFYVLKSDKLENNIEILPELLTEKIVINSLNKL
jgi:thiol:disulfide interchange protein/DsbC/DsbD-like thiol-disulfide interchange protein